MDEMAEFIRLVIHQELLPNRHALVVDGLPAYVIERDYGRSPRLSKSDFAVRQTLITLVPEASFAVSIWRCR